MKPENDPVLIFAKRVNDEAKSNPLWDVDYALAFYQEFSKTLSWHILNNFNEEDRQKAIDVALGRYADAARGTD